MCKKSAENASQGQGIWEGQAIMERTPHPSPHPPYPLV